MTLHKLWFMLNKYMVSVMHFHGSDEPIDIIILIMYMFHIEFKFQPVCFSSICSLQKGFTWGVTGLFGLSWANQTEKSIPFIPNINLDWQLLVYSLSILIFYFFYLLNSFLYDYNLVSIKICNMLGETYIYFWNH